MAITRPCASAVKVTTWSFVGKGGETMTTTALTIFEDGSALDRATRLATLPEGERRRRAVEACRDYDAGVLWEIADAWLTTYGGAGARTSAHTRRAYQRGVQDLVQAWHKGGQSLLRPPRDAGVLWVRGLEASRRSTSTVRVRLSAARALYAALRWAGATEADPFRDARPARDPTPREEKRKPYTGAEMEALLGAATPMERALLLLAGHGGLRAQEMVDLTWADVTLDVAQLVVQAGKGGRLRTVVMSRSLVAALRAIRPPDVAEGARVLPFDTTKTARVWMARMCARAGVTQRGVHAGRHHAGTRIVSSGGTLEAAARHLGHTSLDTTRVYVAWSDESLRASVGEW